MCRPERVKKTYAERTLLRRKSTNSERLGECLFPTTNSKRNLSSGVVQRYIVTTLRPIVIKFKLSNAVVSSKIKLSSVLMECGSVDYGDTYLDKIGSEYIQIAFITLSGFENFQGTHVGKFVQ